MLVNDGCKYTLLELSAKVEYALLALIELASQSSEYSLHDLCQRRDSRQQVSHMYYI